MDKVVMISSSDSSPRSTLKWKEYWGSYESGRLSPSNSKRLAVRPSSDIPDGPKTPPPQLERRQFRSGSLSPSVDLETYGGPCGSPLDPYSGSATEERPVALAGKPCVNSPPTPTLRAFQLGGNVERGRHSQSSELHERIWRQDPTTVKNSSLPFSSSGSSSGRLSIRDDDDSKSLGTSDEESVRNVGSLWSSASASPQSRTARSKNRMQVTSSATDDLNSIRSCVKQAIDLGIKVQHCDSLEVSQLRQDKANAEAELLKWTESNRKLEEQLSTLRGEVQTVQWERELDVLAFNKAIRGLETERNTLMQAARDEKKRREKLQKEFECVLSLLVEEKQQLESDRIAHDTAMQRERKKVQSVKKERDAAVKALQDATQKLNIERDAMVIAMRDLNSSLDLERDANLSSLRRSSVDMATMMSSGYRLSGNRKNSLTRDDDAPFSRSRSRRSSKPF